MPWADARAGGGAVVHRPRAHQARRTDPLRRELDAQLGEALPLGPAVARCVVGLTVLLVGSKLVVFGASEMARAFGVSDLVIGLTVVAVGTSLPELAASVASALRGEPDMAVGNVLGSNMFNLLPVLAIAGLVQPFELEALALQRDFPIMAVLTVVLFVMCMGRRGPGKVTRMEGGVLLAASSATRACSTRCRPESWTNRRTSRTGWPVRRRGRGCR